MCSFVASEHGGVLRHVCPLALGDAAFSGNECRAVPSTHPLRETVTCSPGPKGPSGSERCEAPKGFVGKQKGEREKKKRVLNK